MSSGARVNRPFHARVVEGVNPFKTAHIASVKPLPLRGNRLVATPSWTLAWYFSPICLDPVLHQTP